MIEPNPLPERIVVLDKSSDTSVEWTLQPDLVAVSDSQDLESSDYQIQSVDKIQPDTNEKTLDGDQDASFHFPVYRIGEEGPLGVPTGVLYVRLVKGASLTSLESKFKNLGLVVLRTSPISTTGWLEHESSDLNIALSIIEQLDKLSEILVIEPQVIYQKENK